MRRVFGSIMLVSVLAVASWALGPGSVDAAVGDGTNAQTIHADCGGAGPVDVVINFQSGQFAAAHVVGGGTFVPTGFGEQTVTFTAPDGHTQTFTQPPITKGQSSHASGDAVTCAFDFTATDRKSGGTLHIVGTVTGIIHG